MPHLKKYTLLLLTLCYFYTYAQPGNDSVFKLSVLRAVNFIDVAKNKPISISYSSKPHLFIFLSPECPLCQNYTRVLNSLYQQYAGSVDMYGIFPGKAYSIAQISAFAKKYNVRFPLLMDGSFKLSRYLKAEVTPEAIFLNAGNQLIYRGAIDNWYKDLGKARIKATENYLFDAIVQTQQNRTAPIKRTAPVGCLINDN